MKIPPETAVTLAAGVVLGLGAFWVLRRAESAAEGVAGLPGQVWGAVVDTVAGAVDELSAMAESAGQAMGEARQAVADSSAGNPGYQLPAGWYRVKTRWGEVVTRHPDSFKTLNPNDTLGLIDP